MRLSRRGAAVGCLAVRGVVVLGEVAPEAVREVLRGRRIQSSPVHGWRVDAGPRFGQGLEGQQEGVR